MKKNKFVFWLIVFMIVGGLFRIINLDKNPPHLGNDEISIAYDSYSIRTTGKDEYGTKLPLSFKSHRDYKAPFYTYLNVPFNLLFGNNEYGVRLLSAFAGIIGILLVGLVGKILGGDKLGILAAFLLTINPKSIFVSRMSYESNLASILVLLGVYLILKYRDKLKNKYLFLAGLSLGFSIWTYHTQKGLVPLLLILFPLLWIRKIKLKKWIILWVTTLIVIIPIFWDFVMVQMKDPYNRASSQIWFQGEYIQNYINNTNDIFFVKITKILVDPLIRYIDHFDLDLLFFRGLDLFDKYEPLNFGWFLIATLPILIIGLIKSNKYLGKENWVVLLFWWLICPVIPSLTHGEVSAVRNLSFIAPTTIIMAVGLLSILKNKKYFFTMIIIIFINFYYFLIAYFVHFPKNASDRYQYGYKQAWEEIRPIVNNFEKVVVEPRFGINGQFVGLPRLYFGYFGAFNSTEMLNRDDQLNKIGKFWIRNVNWNAEVIDKNSIYIVSISNPVIDRLNSRLELFSTIYKTNGEKQFLIYKTKLD
jgi:4-amino-4-deoxy-L-arabinose transferase-like glycosyltransferase